MLYGEEDVNVSKDEINDIFKNLKGSKKLVTFPLAGHENYLIKYKKEWIEAVTIFFPKDETP